MLTLVFYVLLCNADTNECNAFEPMSWTYTTEAEREKAFSECSILVNAYDELSSVKETDCYIEE